MCGFAGRWSRGGEAPSAHLLDTMAHALRHRGPDGQGTWRGADIGLAHRRLAVIDLAGGAQPMASEDGRTILVFNGEIFNFEDLRSRLEGLGHRFRTRSDTEVVLRGYLQWGRSLPAHLWGQFAFMVWDGHAQGLFGARDRLGQKPLYWSARGGEVWFGSEVKALLQDRTLERRPDWAAVDAFMRYGYVPAPRTGFHGIWKLLPGHSIWFEREGEAAIRPYWTPDTLPDAGGSDDAFRADVECVLDDAILRRLVADVPLGAFLSGGVDSSLVASTIARAGDLRSFSVGFEEAGFDESAHAAQVAEQIGARHTGMRVHADAASVLPAMVWHFDEPFADASAVPVWYLSRATREHVTVALSGDGGDETFAGYDRYVGPGKVAAWRRLPASLRRSMRRVLGPRTGGPGLGARVRNLNRRSLMDPAELFLHYHLKGDWNRPRSWGYGPALLESAGSADGARSPGDMLTVERALSEAPQGFPVHRMQTADLRTYLPDDINMKVDRMSMAHGLEVRAPFLDHRVVEAGLRLPEHLRIDRGRSKVLLRDLARIRLSSHVPDRPKKGFTVPLGSWFNGDLSHAAELLVDRSRLVSEGVLARTPLRTLLEEHRAGACDWGGRLWMILNLELWYRLLIDSPGSDEAPGATLVEVLES